MCVPGVFPSSRALSPARIHLLRISPGSGILSAGESTQYMRRVSSVALFGWGDGAFALGGGAFSLSSGVFRQMQWCVPADAVVCSGRCSGVFRQMQWCVPADAVVLPAVPGMLFLAGKGCRWHRLLGECGCGLEKAPSPSVGISETTAFCVSQPCDLRVYFPLFVSLCFF
jgi:hypothetical protein